MSWTLQPSLQSCELVNCELKKSLLSNDLFLGIWFNLVFFLFQKTIVKFKIILEKCQWCWKNCLKRTPSHGTKTALRCIELLKTVFRRMQEVQCNAGGSVHLVFTVQCSAGVQCNPGSTMQEDQCNAGGGAGGLERTVLSMPP